MRLYYASGACSLSPHIVLKEADFNFDIESVDLKTKRTQSGADFTAINSNGYVPAVRIDADTVLTEGVAIVQYLADLKPEARLAPKAGTIARARLQEHLNFISSELHKAFSPLFSADASAASKAAAHGQVLKHLAHVERVLADGRPYTNSRSR